MQDYFMHHGPILSWLEMNTKRWKSTMTRDTAEGGVDFVLGVEVCPSVPVLYRICLV